MSKANFKEDANDRAVIQERGKEPRPARIAAHAEKKGDCYNATELNITA